MKKLFLLFSFPLLFTFSCSSDKDEPIETILEISDTEFLFSANEETKYLNIESNDTWVISEIPSWLTIDKEEGYGSSKIGITSSANPKEEERFAILKISIKDKNKEVKIRQVAKNVTLAISKSELIFSAESEDEEQSFEIISNEAWSLVEIPDWCTFDITEGTENSLITVTAKKNYIDTERIANIQVKAGSKTEYLEVIQRPLEIEITFVDEKMEPLGKYLNMDLTYKATSKAVKIKSNTKWTLDLGAKDEWYKIDKLEGENNETLMVSITENKSKTGRISEIIITTGTKSIKFVISQGKFIEVDENNPYQINERDNYPQIGDRLIKKQIEYVEPGMNGENITWNFSNLKIIDNEYTVNYDAPPISENGIYHLGSETFIINEIEPNSLFVCTEHFTMYYFQLKDNLLHATGHENPTIELQYNPRMIKEMYPTFYNDYYKYDYKSKGLYSGTVSLEREGYFEMKADGYGSVILPTGNYDNVLRIKYIQTIKGIDSEENIQEYTTCKWYVKGYRYPVLETHRMAKQEDNSEIFATAFYYPPIDHSYLEKDIKLVPFIKKATFKQSNTLNKEFSLENIFPILRLNNK
ncbi:MAG: BACON domain-containing protein [Dysgonomonas sp.]|nr:BACON domain-containing protein [Dysgonomonas sp.]